MLCNKTKQFIRDIAVSFDVHCGLRKFVFTFFSCVTELFCLPRSNRGRVSLDEVSTAGMLSKSLHGWIHGGFSKGYPVPVTGYRLTEVINVF